MDIPQAVVLLRLGYCEGNKLQPNTGDGRNFPKARLARLMRLPKYDFEGAPFRGALPTSESGAS